MATTSQITTKGLPPPPLKIEKRRNDPNAGQYGASQQWPTTADGPSTSASGPSHLNIDESAKLTRTPSGRFRLRVPSLSKQAKCSEPPQPQTSAHNATTHPSHSRSHQGKAWQPRWAPKLKRTNPSESVTTYSPILDGALPPLPTSIASPPPAVQLDDAGFGRPFSTTGLLDLNASRFSFLDMSNKDRDSDSESQESHGATTLVQHLPEIHEPSTGRKHVQARPPLSTISSATTAGLEPATASSSLQAEPSRGLLGLPASTSSLPTESSRSPRPSLVAASPALGSLISSFPSPLTHERPLHGAPSFSNLRPAGAVGNNGGLEPPAMQKENSWDGGERVQPGHAPTELPYLDMDEESDTELLQATVVPPSSATVQPQPGPSSISPPRNRPIRNPPPRPAPNMALPELPAKASTITPASSRQHTPSSSVQLDALPQANDPPSTSTSRPAQRPLILPSLRSSSSIDRLAAMGSSSSSPLDEATLTKMANGSNLKPLTLPRSASTDELARSLDIPREAVKQMLDTTQHVWRNHLLGSSALLTGAPSDNDGDKQISRSSSSPMLSTMFASQGSSDRFTAGEDVSKASVAKPSAGRGSNRASMLGLPYISSSRPSFEHQSPGWAVSKNSMDAPRPSAYDLHAERAKHRRTFLGRSSEDGPAASYNFSRPMRCEDAAMAASVSMPSLAAARAAPKPRALLQSPLLLKGESEATGFAQFVADDEQEVLVDSSSEAHQPFVLAPAPLANKSEQGDTTAESPFGAGRINMHKPMPELPGQTSHASPRLVRRNSDTVLNRFAPEFGKRAPGELHAWSVCIDADGVPAIRPSPSAFHRPNCPLAGKNNATWQCGCRSSFNSDPVTETPQRPFAPGAPLLLTPGQSSPGRNRSLSASNAMDPIRQAQLWSQVERNKELIRKHQEEIAGLQEQVVRISTEMGSQRPSFSSVLATPDLAAVTAFPVPPARPDASGGEAMARVVSPQLERPAVPVKRVMLEPFPVAKEAPLPEPPVAAPMHVQPPRTLRGRIASLSKMNLAREDDSVRATVASDAGHSRLRSSSSSSSLNKVFRFPWSRSNDKVTTAFPEPTPFMLGDRNHRKATSTASLREKALPRVRMYSVDESRPLPAPPLDASVSGKDKRFPPSARKFSYDMLRGPAATHSSVGTRHLRGRSGSSKSSSFGTSIFSSNEGHEVHEASRFASFPRLGRRWDSISSRGTNVSARNSAEVAAQPGGSWFGSMPSLTSKTMPELPQSDPKLPPPRRSSLLRKSLEAPPRRTPIPNDFLQANDAGMAPISEQSEMGSPASARQATIQGMSPASVVASPAGAGRMSMSERYRLQGLTVPAPLALSSSLTSPALGSFVEPGSGTKVGGEGPRSPGSQRSPLPVTFSHGALTVVRRPSVAGRG